jgi:steroid delta-isomerase-like uncharacterized protein
MMSMHTRLTHHGRQARSSDSRHGSRIHMTVLMAAILSAGWIGCDAQPGGTAMSMEEANKTLIRRIIEEGVNTGNLDAFRETLAPDYRRHSQATLEMPEIAGPDQMIAFLSTHFTSFPDWREDIEIMIAEGDKVAYITRGTGTQTGPMGDIPATGRTIEVMNYIIQRIENGKIAETWIGWDNLSVLMQLGVFPPPAAGGEPAS